MHAQLPIYPGSTWLSTWPNLALNLTSTWLNLALTWVNLDTALPNLGFGSQPGLSN